MAAITNETATTTEITTTDDILLVMQWQGVEDDDTGWYVYDNAGNGNIQNFLGRFNSRVEAVEWALSGAVHAE